jgi:hypothetical protein
MNKSGFSYLKLTAVVAVLALTVIAGVRPSTATKQPLVTAAAVPSADLANEERALAKYFDDLASYHNQSAELAKKASLVKADLDPLQRRSDDLKGRLSGLQNVIREIVRKLKAANEWDDLDTTTAAKITDARQKSFFQQESFKQLLEESSNSLSSHGNEISLPLDNLRKKLTSRTFPPYGADLQIVQAAYEAPAPVKFYSVGCSIGGIRWRLIQKLGGTPTLSTEDQVSCACGNTTGIGTGAKCSDLGY